MPLSPLNRLDGVARLDHEHVAVAIRVIRFTGADLHEPQSRPIGGWRDRRYVLPRRDYEGRARRGSVLRCLLLMLRGANALVMVMRSPFDGQKNAQALGSDRARWDCSRYDGEW